MHHLVVVCSTLEQYLAGDDDDYYCKEYFSFHLLLKMFVAP
jgi:hypothetical protein